MLLEDDNDFDFMFVLLSPGYRRYTPRHLRYAALLVLEDKTGIKKADVRVIEDFVKRTQVNFSKF